MEFLFAINICVAVTLFFWPLWFSKVLRLPGINPITIVMALGLPFQFFRLFGGPLALIDDGLFERGYQFALLMSNLQTIIQFLALLGYYHLFGRLRIERQMPWRQIVLSRHDLRRSQIAFLVLFGATFYLLTSRDFGFFNWISNPREGYQFHRTGGGHWYALATSFLGVSFLLSFLASPRARSVIYSTLVHTGFAYLLGSKGTILAIFGSSLIFLWFLNWPHLKKFILFGAPLVFALLIFNLFLAMSEGFGLQSVLEYFDYFKNASDYYNAYFLNKIDLFHGEVFASSFWAYVPRSFWPDKPFVYGQLLVNEVFFPGQAELTNTPAFGGAVEEFSDFGVVGVIVFSMFSMQSISMAVLAYLIYRRREVNVYRVTSAAICLMVVQFAPMFGSYFPGALYASLLFFVVITVKFLRRRRYSATASRRAPTGGHSPASGSVQPVGD